MQHTVLCQVCLCTSRMPGEHVAWNKLREATLHPWRSATPWGETGVLEFLVFPLLVLHPLGPPHWLRRWGFRHLRQKKFLLLQWENSLSSRIFILIPRILFFFSSPSVDSMDRLPWLKPFCLSKSLWTRAGSQSDVMCCQAPHQDLMCLIWYHDLRMRMKKPCQMQMNPPL